MFNKEKSNENKKISVSMTSYKKIGCFLLTTVLTTLLASQVQAEVISCGGDKAEYLKKVADYTINNQYEKEFSELYEKSQIRIDGKLYSIDDFVITFSDTSEEHDFHLRCTSTDYTDILLGKKDNYKFNRIVYLKDTTAFVELINSDSVLIEDNIITIIDIDKANSFIKNWDGFIHDKVAKTDAVANKDLMRR